jgi:purine-binding chemotaxis protein CheW
MAEVSPQSNVPESLVVFSVGSLRLGVDVRCVSEVTRMIRVSMPLPGNNGVIGMTTLRGESTIVIDVGRTIGLEPTDTGRSTRLIAVHNRDAHACLQVDHVFGLEDINADAVEPASSVLWEGDIQWTNQVVRAANGDLIGILDLHELVSKACERISADDPVEATHQSRPQPPVMDDLATAAATT